MSWFSDICEAFDVKPNAALGVIGGILSLASMAVGAAQASYSSEDEQKRLEDLVRQEVLKSNGRGYR